jgi:hypothetical protein
VDLHQGEIDLGSRPIEVSRNDQADKLAKRLIQAFYRMVGGVVFGRAGRTTMGGAALWVATADVGPVV